MKRDRLYIPNDIFDLLPTEKIKASEVLPGDIFLGYNQWGLVYDNELGAPDYNNGHNQLIHCINGGGSYLSPDHEVTIIQRSLVDKEKAQAMLVQHEFEQIENERMIEEEEKEERSRLRDMRDRLNRELGEE